MHRQHLKLCSFFVSLALIFKFSFFQAQLVLADNEAVLPKKNDSLFSLDLDSLPWGRAGYLNELVLRALPAIRQTLSVSGLSLSSLTERFNAGFSESVALVVDSTHPVTSIFSKTPEGENVLPVTGATASFVSSLSEVASNNIVTPVRQVAQSFLDSIVSFLASSPKDQDTTNVNQVPVVKQEAVLPIKKKEEPKKDLPVPPPVLPLQKNELPTPAVQNISFSSTGISNELVDKKLADLEKRIFSRAFSVPAPSYTQTPAPIVITGKNYDSQIDGLFRAIALTGKIDKLNTVSIANATIPAGTFGGTVTGNVTGTVNGSTGAFTGPITTASTLTVDGASTLAGILSAGTTTIPDLFVTGASTSTFAGAVDINASTGTSTIVSNLAVGGNIRASKFLGDGSGLTGVTVVVNPAGINKQIQFNDNSTLGASSNLTFDKGSGSGTGLLTASGTIAVLNSSEAVSVGYANTASNYFASAFGYGDTASGEGSSAFGYNNQATLMYSTAVGYNNSSSLCNFTSTFGYSNIASGIGSSAVGSTNNSSGSRSSSYGYQNEASGENSSAFGYINTSQGAGSLSLGNYNTASGDFSSSVGYSNNASNITASAFGFGNTASSNCSSAFGYINSASDSFSSAFGYKNVAAAPSSSVFGYCNTAVSLLSSAVGSLNGVCGICSSAFGSQNQINSNCSTAVGFSNYIVTFDGSGGSSVFGQHNSISGDRDTVLGNGNVVSDVGSSVVVGNGNTMSAGGASVFGSGITNNVATSTMIGPNNTVKLNIVSTPLCGVGIGAGIFSRSASFCVDNGVADCSVGLRDAGTIYAVSAAVGAADLAENYPTKDTTLSVGEIVSLDPSNSIFVSRASSQVALPLIGIVSTKPGFELAGFNGADFKNEKKVPVALSGRIPTKVNLEGGAIAVGDRIALSSVPGVGRKAVSGDETVGIALESFTGGSSGTILVFAENRQYVAVSAQASVTTSGFNAHTMFSLLESAGVRIADGIAYIKSAVIDKLTVKELIVNSFTIKNEQDVSKTGFVIYDRATTQPVCVFVANGVIGTAQGECDTPSVGSQSASVNTSVTTQADSVTTVPSEVVATPDASPSEPSFVTEPEQVTNSQEQVSAQ